MPWNGCCFPAWGSRRRPTRYAPCSATRATGTSRSGSECSRAGCTSRIASCARPTVCSAASDSTRSTLGACSSCNATPPRRRRCQWARRCLNPRRRSSETSSAPARGIPVRPGECLYACFRAPAPPANSAHCRTCTRLPHLQLAPGRCQAQTLNPPGDRACTHPAPSSYRKASHGIVARKPWSSGL